MLPAWGAFERYRVKNPILGMQAESRRTFLTCAARFCMTLSHLQPVKTKAAGDAGGATKLLSWSTLASACAAGTTATPRHQKRRSN